MAGYVPPIGMAAGFHNQSKKEKNFLADVLEVPKEHQIKIRVSIDEDPSINGGKPHYFIITSPIVIEDQHSISFDLMTAHLLQDLENKFAEVRREIYGK